MAQAQEFDGRGQTGRLLIDLKNETVTETEREHYPHSTQSAPYEVEMRYMEDGHRWFVNDKEITAMRPYAGMIAEVIAMDETRVGALLPVDGAGGYLGYYKFAVIDLAQDEIIQECPMNVLAKGEEYPTYPDEAATEPATALAADKTKANQNSNASAHANAAALEAMFPKNSAGELVPPDFFGGMYYNDDFQLVVQLVENATPGDPALYKRVKDFLAQNNEIIAEHVIYSERELKAVMEVLDAYWTAEKRPEAFGNVDSYALDTINNRVEVRLGIYNEEEVARFLETVVDAPEIVFVRSRGKPVLL